MRQPVRFIVGTAAIYAATVGVLGYILCPSTHILHAEAMPTAHTYTASVPLQTQSSVDLVTGIPTRIVIPDYAIDLPVDAGYYNETNGSWTLSQTHAQYATMTYPANTISGNTLIYGHGTDKVFGKLSAKEPAVGTLAEIYTDNGHVFSYAFADSRDLTPDDISILAENTGKPTLTVQTCTGAFSQWRTMFRFDFKEIIQ